jgi:FAD/FMN-containing dehydrogenase
MPPRTVASLDNGVVTLSDETVEAFRAGFSGRLVFPEDSDYDEIRAIWNAMIDRKPAVIARCSRTQDVIECVNLAREHGLLTSVRGAGHNIAGKAVCDDGLMIDLSLMNQVQVDEDARVASAGPGATLADFDAETQKHGLATVLGINSTTGVAGLTLGGGFGWLSRKYGLTVDNLLAADVVTADGQLLHTSQSENDDLFWGIRGGGGNLGIVTSFEFQLHEVGPSVLSGLIIHPFEVASEALPFYRDFCAGLPDELSVWVVMRHAPPLPFLPEDFHGRLMLAFATVYAGDPEEGERLLAPLREWGEPVADVVQPNPYAGFQQAFDPLLEPGARNYWKSHNFTEISDGLIDTLIRYVENLPSPQSEIFIGQMGGATNRVAADATAYPHRDAEYIMNVHTRWTSAEQDEECVAWARELFDATAPFATGGVYVNFVSEDEDRVAAAYGENYARLAELKRKYDPTNLFRTNQNVAPVAS